MYKWLDNSKTRCAFHGVNGCLLRLCPLVFLVKVSIFFSEAPFTNKKCLIHVVTTSGHVTFLYIFLKTCCIFLSLLKGHFYFKSTKPIKPFRTMKAKAPLTFMKCQACISSNTTHPKKNQELEDQITKISLSI